MNRPTRGAMSQAILACVAALSLLAQTAVADYTPFTISTMGSGSLSYNADESVGIMMGGTGTGLPLMRIAVGFTFLLDDTDDTEDPTVQGAVVNSLTVPFFVDLAETDLVNLSFIVVADLSPDDGSLDGPDFSSVIATFSVPGSWPGLEASDGSESSLPPDLPRSSSSTFIDSYQYWLVMQQTPKAGMDVNFAYWHRDLNSTGDVFVYSELDGSPTTGTGTGEAAPAYSLTFTTVPEPSAGALLALAGVASLWRRRRRA